MKQRNIAIDYLRGLAMLAVVFDHLYGWGYDVDWIHELTFFSVTLFILCGGFTAYLSMHKKGIANASIKELLLYEKNRLVSILIPYMVASAFCLYIDGGYKQIIKNYASSLVSFNAAAPYYYFIFFIQLVLISPFLFKLLEKIKNSNFKILISLLIFVVMAYFFTEKTDLGPIHGGGKYLLGGSFFPIYYLGMIVAAKEERIKKLCSNNIAILLSGLLLLVYSLLVYKGGPIFNSIDYIYLSWLYNPPGLRCSIYTALIFIFHYGVINRLSNIHLASIVCKIIAIIGRRSLDIFLYHLYFIIIMRNTFFLKFPAAGNYMVFRITSSILVGVMLPVLIRELYEKAKLSMKSHTKANGK